MASSTMLSTSLMYTISGSYYSIRRRHLYTWSDIIPRASLVRLLWPAKISTLWPNNMPLKSLNIYTIDTSFSSVMLYFYWCSLNFLTKKAIGLLYCVMTAPSCILDVSVYITRFLEMSRYTRTISLAIIFLIASKDSWWVLDITPIQRGVFVPFSR